MAALLLVSGALRAHAQQINLGNLSPSTVVGRLGSSVPGPAQAIPFATLLAQLNGVNGVMASTTPPTVINDLATWANTGGTALKDAGGGTVGGTYTWSGTQTFADAGTWGSSGLSGTYLNGSPVGASTASSGAFTTLSASSTVSGAGFSTYLASPPAIGGTSASAGTFTTLTLIGQLVPAYGTPTIASGACGATTNGTIASGGTNQSGEVVIASATTTTCTVSFSTTLGAAPRACLLTPGNSQAASENTASYISAITTAHFVITGSTLASTDWYYHCF